MVVKQFDLGTIVRVMAHTDLEAPVLLPEPRLEEMTLEAVFQALGDPVRLEIVRKLHARGQAQACGTLDLPVGKSTASHHFKVLREAGLIRQRVEGRTRFTELRLADVEERFPGLLKSVLAVDR
jgi:DNA-binding transcriptional ArsR family regulator